MIWKTVTLLSLALCAQAHQHATSEQMIKRGHSLEHQGHHGELDHIGSHEPEHHEGYAWAYPTYEFSYSVNDPHTHDHKGQYETRHGDEVKGEYWLLQPDGKKRTVKYHANKHSGFKAHVSFADHHHHEEPHKEEIIKPVVELVEEEPHIPLKEIELIQNEEEPEKNIQEEQHEERKEEREEQHEEKQEEMLEEKGEEENHEENIMPIKHRKPVHIEFYTQIQHPIHLKHHSHAIPDHNEHQDPIHVEIPIIHKEDIKHHDHEEHKPVQEKHIPIVYYKPLVHHEHTSHHKSIHHHIPVPLVHYTKFGTHIQHPKEHHHSEEVHPIQVDEVGAQRKHQIELPQPIPLRRLHNARYHRDHRKQRKTVVQTKH